MSAGETSTAPWKRRGKYCAALPVFFHNLSPKITSDCVVFKFARLSVDRESISYVLAVKTLFSNGVMWTTP